MDGTEMLIGRAVCVMNPRARSRRLLAQAREPRHFVFARPSPPRSSIFPYFLPSSLVRHRLFLKERLTDAPSAGAPFHHTPNPLLAPSSFIPPDSPKTPPPLLPTISQESWRHYATRWNTVTSLSRWRRAQCLPTSVLQQLHLSPLPIPSVSRPSDERERLWLPFSARQPISHCGWLVHL